MTSTANISIDQALCDTNLLGAALGSPESWGTWLAVLRAAFGLPLDHDQSTAFEVVAGGRPPPQKRVRELWAIIGRRSGKSRIAAAIATFIAAFIDHREKLSPGETGTVLVLAASRQQATAVFRYVQAFFEESPILSQLIDNVTSDEIRLNTRVTISVHTNSHRTIRGRTLIACVFDEVGFWRDENSANPDVETYRAVLPALATTKGMLIGISSPYAKRGLLYQKHVDSFGQDDPDNLVVQGATPLFNSTIDTDEIAKAKASDPEAAAAEWDAQFRGDLSTFVDRAVVEACVEPGIKERPPQRYIRYNGFVDPSGGAHDAMTLAIAHREDDSAVLDCVREIRPPFSPADVVAEFSETVRRYNLTSVTGDRYAGEWVAEAFRENGIRYVQSERTKSEIYLDALPSLMAGTASLMDDDRLVNQISQLERRTSRSGKDRIDHMRGAQDDLANAALGALVHVSSPERRLRTHHAPKVNLGYATAKALTRRRYP